MNPAVAIIWAEITCRHTHTHTHTHTRLMRFVKCLCAGVVAVLRPDRCPLRRLCLSLFLSLPLYVSEPLCQRGVMLSCRTVSKYDQTTARQWPSQADDNCSSITLELDCCVKLNVILKKNWRLGPP